MGIEIATEVVKARVESYESDIFTMKVDVALIIGIRSRYSCQKDNGRN